MKTFEQFRKELNDQRRVVYAEKPWMLDPNRIPQQAAERVYKKRYARYVEQHVNELQK